MDSQDKKYTPIDCTFHDRLLDWATIGRVCSVEYKTAGGELKQANGIIKDVFARAGAEYLLLDSGLEIRLDDLHSVNGIRLPGS